jgi:hypothetical protein
VKRKLKLAAGGAGKYLINSCRMGRKARIFSAMYILKKYSFSIILLLLLGIHMPAHAAFRISNKVVDTPARVLTANAGGRHEPHIAPKQRQSGALGTLAFIFGIIAFLMGLAGYPFIFIPAAIILGAISLARAKKNKGLAIAGIALAVVAIFLVLIQNPGIF